MRYTTWIRRATWPLALGVMVLGATAAVADDETAAGDPPPPRREPPRPPEGPRPPRGPDGPRDPRERAREIIERHHQSYLGISAGRVPASLDAQLELKGEGVLVTSVGPGGPADKGGVKPNDIVLAAGDKSVKDTAELSRIAKESEGKELSLKLMRAGKPTTVTVTPEKSAVLLKSEFSQLRDLPDVRDIEETIRERLHDLGADMRMQIIQRGAMLPKGADFLIDRRADLPDDLSIKIQKEGKKPADIEVKQGDKTWTVKEDDLAPLPDEVRRNVEGFLGHGPMRLKIVGLPGGPDGDGPHPPHPPRPPRDGRDEDGFGPGDGPPPGGPDGPRPPRARRPGRGPEDGGPDGPPPPRRGDRPERGGPDRGGPDARGPDDGGPDGPLPRGRGDDEVQRRFNQLNERLREMHDQLDGLRRELRDGPGDRPERPRRPDRREGPEPPERPQPPRGDDA